MGCEGHLLGWAAPPVPANSCALASLMSMSCFVHLWGAQNTASKPLMQSFWTSGEAPRQRVHTRVQMYNPYRELTGLSFLHCSRPMLMTSRRLLQKMGLYGFFSWLANCKHAFIHLHSCWEPSTGALISR